MEPQTIELSRLQELSATSLQLTYNTDAADTLSLTLRPENYAKLPLEARQRLTVTDGDRVVFSGLVPMGANCAAQAAAGETVDITLQSDYYVLDHTVYARLNAKGEAVFARTPVYSKMTTLSAVCGSVRNWLDDYLPSRLVCDIDATIPTPTSNGTAPCSSLLHEGMRWVPDTVMVQRYGETGNTLRLSKPEQLGEPLVLSPHTAPLQSVSLQARDDLQVPVCALVGGVHAVYPQGGDIRELGAFVYAVPVDQTDENQRGGAGSAPASQKMVVKGIDIPERKHFESSSEEFEWQEFSTASKTAKFINAFLPEYAPFMSCLNVGSCLVSILGKNSLSEDDEDDKDEDAKAPENYEEDVHQWETWQQNIYAHTEGSFPASANRKKNVKGLKWCKAVLTITLAVRLGKTSNIPTRLKQYVDELFPGRRKKIFEKVKRPYAYVQKTFNINLINRRKKIYDPATNKLCSTDSEYEAENEAEAEDTPTALDYKAAMKHYYDVASKLQHEGSISMLYDGSLNPAELTGRRVLVNGLRPEWEDMNAIIRSVSWNYEQRKLSLSLGTRAVMGFEEYLERRLLARNRGRDKSQEEALAYDTLDTETQKEEEAYMSVSPSISAKTDSTSAGRWIKPFTLFIEKESGNLIMRGGVLRKGDYTVEVEDSEKQIKDGKKSDEDWSYGEPVRIRWKTKSDKTITFDLYQS